MNLKEFIESKDEETQKEIFALIKDDMEKALMFNASPSLSVKLKSGCNIPTDLRDGIPVESIETIENDTTIKLLRSIELPIGNKLL